MWCDYSVPSSSNSNSSPTIVIVKRNSPNVMTTSTILPKIDTPKMVHYANLQQSKRGVSAEPARSKMSFPPTPVV